MIVSKKNYAIHIDEKTGNIAAFYGRTGVNYLEKPVALADLTFIKEGGERVWLATGDALSVTEKKGVITVRYEGVGGADLSVTATFDCTDETFVKARLKFENRTGMRAESVRFPNVLLKNRLGVNGYKLFWSAMEGVEIDNTNFRNELMGYNDGTVFPAKGWEGVYPGACPMQFMAYYNGEHGFYYASHDGDANLKLVEWKPEDGGIRLIMQLFPAAPFDAVYEYGYDVVLGGIGGTWYDAADVYRAWIETSGLLNMPKLEENGDLPAWLLSSPVAVTFVIRGKCDAGENSVVPNGNYPYTNCLPHIRRYAKAFDAQIMTLLMHWEGTAPWAPPHVWPPYGDTENFKTFTDEIHKDGNLIGLYCSGLGWTQKSLNDPAYNREKDFEEQNLVKCIETGPDNEVRYTTTCFYIRNGYELCPACEQVKDLAAEEARKIATEGDIDYLQFFDQNLGGNTYGCYSAEHGHPPVPGRWMAEEMHKTGERMKAEFRKARPDRKMLIGCEAAACEPLLNDFRFNDLRYNLDYMFGAPVHAYSYMFHEYVTNYMGNHTSATRLLDTRLYPENIFYRTAYSFVQGDILTVMCKNDGKINWEWNAPWEDDNEPDQEAYVAYIRYLNDWRKSDLMRPLRYGRMMRPLRIRTAAYLEKVDRKDLIRVLDEVQTTRFVYEGKDIQIFANFRSKAAVCTVYGANGVLCDTPDEKQGKKICGDAEIELPPRSVKVLVLKG